MSDIRTRIIEAAIRMVLRHGIKRTTMSDFADEAGVSRQTLYVWFPNKEALLRGCIRHMWEGTYSEVTQAFEQTHALRERLEILVDHLAVRPRAMADSSPDSAELIEGTHKYAIKELELVFKEIADFIASVLKPYAHQIERAGLTLEAFARQIQMSCEAIKTRAIDENEVKLLTRTLVLSVLAVCDKD